MRVAVPGYLRAMGKLWLWDVITSPTGRWFDSILCKLQGKPPRYPAYEDLPDWWKALPDGHLQYDENYRK